MWTDTEARFAVCVKRGDARLTMAISNNRLLLDLKTGTSNPLGRPMTSAQPRVGYFRLVSCVRISIQRINCVGA